jgi:hypothetical protein
MIFGGKSMQVLIFLTRFGLFRIFFQPLPMGYSFHFWFPQFNVALFVWNPLFILSLLSSQVFCHIQKSTRGDLKHFTVGASQSSICFLVLLLTPVFWFSKVRLVMTCNKKNISR